MNNTENGRLIGVQHRRKKTKAGEERPTILAITTASPPPDTTTPEIIIRELPDDLSELDFVYGFLPTNWGLVATGGDLSRFTECDRAHHVRFRDPKKDESLEAVLAIWPRSSLRLEQKGRGKNKIDVLTGIPTEVAFEFDGLKPGDTVLGIFGGSGFNLTIALINKAEEIGASVLLVAPRYLKQYRDALHEEKEEDAKLILSLYRKQPELFHKMFLTDVQTWVTMHAWNLTEEAMTQRKKLVQRATAWALNHIFASKEYVGSRLAQAVLDAKMGDQTIQQVHDAEAEAQKALEDAVEKHPLFRFIFDDIKGCGPRFFGKLLSAIRDIRRFPRPHGEKGGIGAFLRFTGYAVVKGPNGKPTIQRFRRNGDTPGNPEIKQAVWLLIDMQFSRQTDTPWGLRFREIKAELQKKHPLPELVCDTEIPLKGLKYRYDEETKSCTVNFGNGRAQVFQDTEIVDKVLVVQDTEIVDKVLVVPKRILYLEEDTWSVKNGLYTIKNSDGSVSYIPGKSQYTKAHMHKITSWKLGTEFLIYVFGKCWEYQDLVDAERAKTKEKQLAA